MKLIKSLEVTGEATGKSSERRYRLTIAFYLLDPELPDEPKSAR